MFMKKLLKKVEIFLHGGGDEIPKELCTCLPVYLLVGLGPFNKYVTVEGEGGGQPSL